MFEWALIFMVLSLIAAIFGFVSMAVIIVTTARLFFFVFLLLTVISSVAAFFQRNRTGGLIIDIKYGD